MFHFTYCVQKFTVQKKKKQNKKTKKTWNPACSEVLRELSFSDKTHRATQNTDVHVVEAMKLIQPKFSLSVSLSCKVWIQGWGNTEVKASAHSTENKVFKHKRFPSIQQKTSCFLFINFGQNNASTQLAYCESCKANHKTGPRPHVVMSHTNIYNGKSVWWRQTVLLFWLMWPFL